MGYYIDLLQYSQLNAYQSLFSKLVHPDKWQVWTIQMLTNQKIATLPLRSRKGTVSKQKMFI